MVTAVADMDSMEGITPDVLQQDQAALQAIGEAQVIVIDGNLPSDTLDLVLDLAANAAPKRKAAAEAKMREAGIEPGSPLDQIGDKLQGELAFPGAITDGGLGVPVIFEPTSEAKAVKLATVKGLAMTAMVTPNAGEVRVMGGRFRDELRRHAPSSPIL